ncbi:hypothetical protein L596_017779 [Steinernema carpocapsae]|uniref:Uncharacterized protein n=1 Tax=Steinernema carpocapsae TaxID=34508 RepID=A0A4U5N312_STECR|nr:hypothetical protein L596_017779 [Steinernema carpocapsae]
MLSTYDKRREPVPSRRFVDQGSLQADSELVACGVQCDFGDFNGVGKTQLKVMTRKVKQAERALEAAEETLRKAEKKALRV